jgi:putative FmdB family regulatory protein
MPTYDWKCKKCEKPTEVVRKMDDYNVPPHEACECGSKEFTKLLNNSPFSLKGGGWFRDGYESKRDTQAFEEKARAYDRSRGRE